MPESLTIDNNLTSLVFFNNPNKNQWVLYDDILETKICDSSTGSLTIVNDYKNTENKDHLIYKSILSIQDNHLLTDGKRYDVVKIEATEQSGSGYMITIKCDNGSKLGYCISNFDLKSIE